MFERLWTWIKEIIAKMLGQDTIKQTLGIQVAISSDMATALQTWAEMYSNQSSWLTKDIQSLNLAAAIAGEIARAVTIEMQMEVTGSARADYLAEQMEAVLPKLRQMVEYGAAKGGLIFKPYVSGKTITVDYVQADMFYPVTFDANGNITACIFADQRTIGRDHYTRLEYHGMTDAGCEIRNLAYRSATKDNLGTQVSLDTVEAWANLQPEATITGIEKPLFAYFRFPQANNIDPTSPLGVSCYARAVDLIENADRQWSQLLWEFESGQRALYVDASAFDHDTSGNPILPNKRLYRTLNGMTPAQLGEEGFYQEWTPDLREQNILAGLDAILRQVEFTCGLAYGTLSNPQSVDKTATELKISNQRSYATISDTQKALQAALEQLLYAMDVWATLAKLAPRGAFEISYDFDDSIITDKSSQAELDQATVDMGAMPKYVYLMRNYGLDEVTARKWIAETGSEVQNVPDEWYRETEGGETIETETQAARQTAEANAGAAG